MPQPPAEVVSTLEQFGQQHLLQFWDELDDAQQTSLVEQISAIDFEQLKQLATGSHDESGSDRIEKAALPGNLVTLESDANPDQWNAARKLGEEALAAGRVGVVLVAGGQGTRLGFPHPKGMFPIGPVSKHPLFQILAEQVIARTSRSERRFPTTS